MTNEQLKGRTKKFSIMVIDLVEKMPSTISTRVILNQIVKSAT